MDIKNHLLCNFWFVCFLTLLAGSAIAQNPIVPEGVYIADPTARVWPDGKIYVYGSRDESKDRYCSWHYDVMKSDDAIDWQIYPYRFASKGKNDEVSYADDLLYAPDCWYRNGIYYLYYCLSNGTEGVATSDNPTGPFKNGTNIELGGKHQIDPSIFVDDDGQAYYVWGQFAMKMAKMKPNMKELDLSTLKDSVLTEKKHYFHEGAFMTKRNGIYYLVYTHMGRADTPTCIGYATSNLPMGPYKYRGVIIDNDHSDPECWNNHGSIVEFNNQWYVFYHRPTNGCATMRKVCIEPIYFNEDGSIDEVEMTTQGAAGPLDPLKKLGAQRACLMKGNVRVQTISDSDEILGMIHNNDRAIYKYFDFTNDIKKLTVDVAPGEKPGRIDVTIDNAWSDYLGTIEVPGGGDLKTLKTLSCDIKSVSGVHTICFQFKGNGDDIFHVESFKFKK